MKIAVAIILTIIALGLFCITLPILASRDSVSIDEFVKIASLFISWPVAVTIVALVFFSRFREPLAFFLRNIRSVNFPGGAVQVQSQPAGTSDGNEEGSTGVPTFSAEQTEHISQFIAELQQEHDLVNKAKEDLKEEVRKAYNESYGWKFVYLNQFFVYNTKQVLLWFSNQGSPQSRQLFHQAWQQFIPSFNQRDVILEMALRFNMLESDGINLNITTEGYYFLQYIGFIPSAPPSVPT